MIELLSSYKPKLTAGLRDALNHISEDSADASLWTADVIARLLDYCSRGKMIRGALVDIGAKSVDDTKADKTELEAVCIHVGAAMELIQGLLLIHDDIMDQDDLRRGRPSMHTQYTELAAARKALEPRRLGESLGICVGDVAGFLAFDVLSSINLDPKLTKALIALTSRELVYVGLAQMGDVFNAGVPEDLRAEDILKLYRYKTGRYTFSLPLMAGALCAGLGKQALGQLGEIGELFGIIFQIKDDEIGIFGASEKTGKPQGSDILENKRTLHRLRLFENLGDEERQRASGIYGNPAASAEDLSWVRRQLYESGAMHEIDRALHEYAESCSKSIREMTFLTPFGKKALEGLLAYNLSRDV